MSEPAEELDLVIRGSRALGIELEPDVAALLLRYLDLVYRWNSAAGLTTVPRADAVRLHLLDSLAVVRFLPSSGRLADLGSGAGFPGIPIAVALPSVDVVLVETRRKKCSFLAEAVRSMGLRNCSVLEKDARRLSAYAETFDVVVARAFLAPRELLEVAMPVLRVCGCIVVMGARKDDTLDQIAAGDDRLVRVADEAFVLFDGAERRRIIVLKKQLGAS